MFRNRWQDENDIVVTMLLRGAKGNYSVPGGDILIRGLGQKTKFPVKVAGSPTYFKATEHGGVVSTSLGSFGVDFSVASGSPALLVLAGPVTGNVGKNAQLVTAGKNTFTVMTLQRDTAPAIKVEGDGIVIGGQTVGYDGLKIEFAK